MPGNSFAGSDGCAPGRDDAEIGLGTLGLGGRCGQNEQSTAAARICGFIGTV